MPMIRRGRRLPSKTLKPKTLKPVEAKPKEKGPIRKAAESAAKATYTTLNPAVKATQRAVVRGLDTYLSVVDKAAKKIEPYADKLPKMPQPMRGPMRGPRGRGRR